MVAGFFGSDATTVRAQALAHASELATAGQLVERIEAMQYEPGALRDVVEAVSLFGDAPAVYVIDTPSANEEFWHEFVELASELVASARQFVLIEGALLAAQKKPLVAADVSLTEVKAAGTTERFNTFALADALAARDKRRLWLLLNQARRGGVSDEESIGILWWQLKTMRLAARFTNAAAAGLKPYPFQKATAALKKYTPTETETLARELLTIYHQGHQGECELDLALERWVLSV